MKFLADRAAAQDFAGHVHLAFKFPDLLTSNASAAAFSLLFFSGL
jgi:hypothetical protein